MDGQQPDGSTGATRLTTRHEDSALLQNLAGWPDSEAHLEVTTDIERAFSKMTQELR